MHESHQVQHQIEAAKKALAAKGLSTARRVVLVVGEGLGFDEMSVRLHWEEFAAGSVLENAELVIHSTPARLQCPVCNGLFPKKGSDLSCPKCHVQGIPTQHGREFLIQDIN